MNARHPASALPTQARADNSRMRTCAHCGVQTDQKVEICPACGKPFFSTRKIRTLGSIVLVIGALLAAGMGFALISLAPTLLHPGEQVDGTRFTGSVEQGRLAFGLIGWVALTGATFVVVGLHQVLTGKRNVWLLGWAGVMIAITVVGVLKVNASFG